jgi:monothiol glutaredoxin
MKTPTIRLTDSARRAFQEAMAQADGALRLVITERFEHQLSLDERAAEDIEADVEGVPILLDPESASRAEGLAIDFVEGPERAGFVIDNPNGPAAVRPLSAPQLKQMIDAGLQFALIDVRTDQERAIARIEGSRLLDQPLHDEILRMDRETPIVFHCHHGMRSQAAAEYFLNAGFRKLYNLEGGIEAWSRMVDPSVPRY